MMTTLVFRTDVHMSDRAPGSRTDDWTETLLDKLRQVGAIAREVNADAVLDGGDFFDVKSPSRNSHALVRAVAEVHRAYPCDVWATVGNHDCVYGDIGYLDQQPLGVLFATGVFQRLYDEHAAMLGGTPEAPQVRVVGIPYHGTAYDLERFKGIEKEGADHLVVVAHVLASPKGGQMFEGEDIVKYADLPKLSPEVGTWMFGHWHKDQGITEVAEGVRVVNIGSLSRGALIQDELDRKPSVVIMRFGEDVSLEVRELDVAPAEEVFDIEGRARKEVRSEVMEAFVDSLQTTLTGGEKVPLRDIIAGLEGVPPKVKERALLYLE